MLLAAAALAGCGGKTREEPPLRFEKLGGSGGLDDTTGLNRGRPLLASLEPYRMSGGAMRVKGRMDLPDGARVQISVYRSSDRELVARDQLFVARGGFDTPPIIGAKGPLPEGDYRFEVLVHFNDTWQSPEVLRATGGGRRLRGPGITRTRQGDAAFLASTETHL